MARSSAPAPARRAASGGTAERFAARVRSRRRRRLAVIVASCLVVTGLIWLTLFSPYLVLDRIRITGTDRVPVAQVSAIVDSERGRPMVLLDPSAVSGRVEELPLVESVQVRRHWPATMTVEITERVPVAAVPAGGGRYRLVDEDGAEVETVADRPAALPFLEVDLNGRPASAAALRTALAVLSGLPETVRARLVGAGATSADGVWLRMTPAPKTAADASQAGDAPSSNESPATGRGKAFKVVWGDSSQATRKAEVLDLLIAASGPDGASTYDVSAPDKPAVDPR